MLKFLDWFAGVGGFREGLERANIRLQQERQEGIKWQDTNNISFQEGYRDTKGANGESKEFHCVGACEIDKYARQVYARRFGHFPQWADSRAVDPGELLDLDLFCAGFPCQSFSIAGKREGFRDSRGNLFFEIVRILRAKRPPYLLLENVKGLLSHGKGYTFQEVLRTLGNLGYDLQWQVLNSKYHGVPQNRERVFIVGHLRGQSRPQVFPLGEDNTANNRECEGCTSYAIDSNYGKGLYTPGRQNQRTMICNNSKIRRLTPLEAERIQGFPDNWTAEGIDEKTGDIVEISDTQRYRMMGNAVTANVIEDIGIIWQKELAQ